MGKGLKAIRENNRKDATMQIGLTGATGFVGRYIAWHLAQQGHRLRCWCRPTSDRRGFEEIANSVEWVEGDLDDTASSEALVAGCDGVIHAALYHPGGGFRGGEGDLVTFTEKNIVGTIRLIEASRRAGVDRFVFISTCAVHEKILDDRPLDEAHPLWPKSHYGAHKAAIEKFVHSYGLSDGYPICALRPTGVYGVARPIQASKWFDLIRAVVRGEAVTCQRGGKEVHAADVAKSAALLLDAPGVAGEAYNCYDRYVSEYEVASIAKRLSGSPSEIRGQHTSPKHQVETGKLRALGMELGGERLLEKTVGELIAATEG
jgi:nucleoside-diphosphate-sugar epimerase